MSKSKPSAGGTSGGSADTKTATAAAPAAAAPATGGISAPVRAMGVTIAGSAPYERPGLSKDETAELKEAFDLFDTTGSGSIDSAELKAAMQALGYNKKNKMVYSMIDNLKSGSIDFPAFLDMMTAKLSDTDSEADLLKVFDLFDEEQKGVISLQSLSRVAKELGENMTTLELKEMIERADDDNDGVINKKEFLALMKLKNPE